MIKELLWPQDRNKQDALDRKLVFTESEYSLSDHVYLIEQERSSLRPVTNNYYNMY